MEKLVLHERLCNKVLPRYNYHFAQSPHLINEQKKVLWDKVNWQNYADHKWILHSQTQIFWLSQLACSFHCARWFSWLGEKYVTASSVVMMSLLVLLFLSLNQGIRHIFYYRDIFPTFQSFKFNEKELCSSVGERHTVDWHRSEL